MTKRCAACDAKLPKGKRKYCSEACSYGGQRARRKLFAAGQRTPHRRYPRVSVVPAPPE